MHTEREEGAEEEKDAKCKKQVRNGGATRAKQTSPQDARHRQQHTPRPQNTLESAAQENGQLLGFLPPK